MKTLPEKFLESLQGIQGFNRETFVKIHESGEQITSVRINAAKTTSVKREKSIRESDELSRSNDILMPEAFQILSHLLFAGPVPWSQYGFYLNKRPSFTFDPLFHAGCYYVQEASSMFLEQAFKQLLDRSQPLKVLDLCAAPGGKSTHIQSLISTESLLVSNEIIRSRNTILVDNIIKWGCDNVIVSNNDPSAFQKLGGYFDVMVVDAPCSGSGLFRKDEEAIDEWSLNNVELCSQRQQRILADALPALKENGILIYSTCSYSTKEDEEIIDWLVEELGMEDLELETDNDWNIVETHSSKADARGFRFYPDKLRGEGLFMACLRKTSGTKEPRYRPMKLEKASRKEMDIIQPWINVDDFELIKDNNSFFALHSRFVADYVMIKSALNIQHQGVGLGKIMKERLVPDHSLALSTAISDQITFNELRYEEAIKYLQRQDLNFNTSVKGWQLVRYKNFNLGWVNVLPNRVNNYYPRELRILKQQNDSAFEKY